MGGEGWVPEPPGTRVWVFAASAGWQEAVSAGRMQARRMAAEANPGREEWSE